MDKVRNDPEKDAWKEANRFFKDYIKYYSLKEIEKAEEEFLPKAEDEKKPIKLLG